MAITNIYKGNVERSDIQKIYKGTTLLYVKVIETGYNVTINEDSVWGYRPTSWAYLSYSFDGGTNWIDLTSNTLPITINDVTQIMFKITPISPGERRLRNITDDVTLLSDAGTTSNLVLTKNTTYEVGSRGGGGWD